MVVLMALLDLARHLFALARTILRRCGSRPRHNPRPAPWTRCESPWTWTRYGASHGVHAGARCRGPPGHPGAVQATCRRAHPDRRHARGPALAASPPAWPAAGPAQCAPPSTACSGPTAAPVVHLRGSPGAAGPPRPGRLAAGAPPPCRPPPSPAPAAQGHGVSSPAGAAAATSAPTRSCCERGLTGYPWSSAAQPASHRPTLLSARDGKGGGMIYAVQTRNCNLHVGVPEPAPAGGPRLSTRPPCTNTLCTIDHALSVHVGAAHLFGF